MVHTHKKTAFDLCASCLDHITSEGAGFYIENPALQFTADAKAGMFDEVSEETYSSMLNDVEQLASLWSGKPRQTAGDILLYILERMPMSPAQLDAIAKPLAELLVWPGPESSDASPAALLPVLKRAAAVRSPKAIRDAVASQVIGQPEAVKAAALVMYNQLSGRRTNAVFAGPSGCGKSEIWRVLSREYPGLVRMVDFSRFSADGWKGSLHLRDIFNGVDPDGIRRRGLVVVLDEADKILCETAVGAGGTNYNAIIQNNLLKMLDGDVIEFGAQENQSALSVDCSRVSVVMLGAFERLLDKKVQESKRIGFGSVPGSDAGKHRNITYEDLIRAGMRREVAGRVNKIVTLDPLSVDDYISILTGPVLDGVQTSIQRAVHMDDDAARALAAHAIKSGLGVRWMKSAILNAMDDAMFDVPEAEMYAITQQDGKLRCKARKPRKSASACTDYDWAEELPF